MAKKTKKVVNSYSEVFKVLSEHIKVKIEPKDLFEVGLNQIKRVDDAKIEKGWKELIKRINDSSSKSEVFVRSHGRNGSGSDDLLILLKDVFGRSFEIDRSNNAAPKRILEDAFEDITYQDYQISHIFEERTNNPLLFGAPWMICYTPKIIDPFTGHESNGFPGFRVEFVKWAYEVNSKYIDEYNDLITKTYWPRLKGLFDGPNNVFDKKFKEHMIVALAPIIEDTEKLSKKDRFKKYVDLFNNQ